MIIDLESRCSSIPAARLLRAPATILQGDSRLVLGTFPDNCMQCVITSPPYWGVRDYGVDGQIGLEPSLDVYLNQLVAAFGEVRRVLKKDGVMWLNIGDVYASGNRKYRTPDTRYRERALATRPRTPAGLKPKDLIGIPWRLAFALQQNGWYLRTEVIWHKTNAMPESVRDRPSRCHEYLFLFSKSQNYRFSRLQLEKSHTSARRTVWSMATGRTGLKGHHAVFPESLVIPCIHASTRKNDLVLDPFCGTGTVGRVCAALDRRFLGIEIKPRYARAAIRCLGAITHWLQSNNGVKRQERLPIPTKAKS